MQVTVIVDKSAFDKAIAFADGIGRHNETVKGLQAPVDGALSGWVSEAWEALRDGLERAYLMGADAARGLLDTADKAIQRVLAEAGKRASEVAVMLREKLRGYVAMFLDEMIKQVRPVLAVGEASLQLKEMHVEQKLILGGSLKAALDEAIALTSNSEFKIDATYRAD
jgi:hypothetical protein